MLQNQLIQEFLKFCLKYLKDYKQVNFFEYPKLTLTVDKNKVQTLASFNPSTNEVICYTPKRLVADVFRSVAHELVHFAQNVKQELTPTSGDTGSPIENEANSLAGIILRDFGKQFPQIFVTSFDELVSQKCGTNYEEKYEKLLKRKYETEEDINKARSEMDNYVKSLFPIVEEDKKNYLAPNRAGFRAGHIEGRKPEDMLRMDSNRSTGHFGTGYYFFGSIDQANQYSKQTGNRDVRIVDFNDYRLFVPNSEYDGFKLHDFFKKLNNNDYTYIARKKAFELISSDRISQYLQQNKIEYDRYNLKELMYDKDIFEQYFYDSNKSNVLKEFDSNDLPTINGIISYVDKVVRPNYKNNLNEIFSKEILPTLTQLNGGKNLSQQQATDIAKLIFSDYRIKNNPNRGSIMGGKDTLSTRIMKYFGWEGIDVRGMSKLDNSEYGSVIYDIKPSSIIKEEETPHKYKYGCLMLDLKFKNWDKFLEQIPDDKLYTEGGDDMYGKEFESHCTVLYGFLENVDVNKIKKSLKTLKKPIQLSLDKINLFENEKFDVLKFNVVSKDLHKLNKVFKENFENHQEYPKYEPHVTIAYVKKGMGKDFVQTLKQPIELESGMFTYSEPNGSKHKIEIDNLDELERMGLKHLEECECEIESKRKDKLEEYAQNIINKLVTNFRTENPNLTDEQINYYIQRFEQLKSSPKVTQKDILKYSFKDLEKLVDSFPTKMKSQPNNKTSNNVEFSDGELIYNKPPLQIFHGDSPKQCIKIKGDFSASWCIARTSGNMYHNYRFGNAEPSFYFVKNLDRLNKISKLNDDPYCFFVVQINNQGKYIVTSALNDGDKEMTWEQLLQIEPLLNGTDKLFVHKSLNPDDKADYRRFENGISDDKYKELSFDMKKKYISITNELSDDKFKNTPDELLNDYISTGVELTDNQYNIIQNNKTLLNNYRRITLKNIIPEVIKGNVDMGSRWLTLTDDEAIDLYNKLGHGYTTDILLYKPSLIKFFKGTLDKQYITDTNVAKILIRNPQLIKYFINENRISELPISDIVYILKYQPSLINYFKNELSKINTNGIRNILREQPTLIDVFKDRLSELSSDVIRIILKNVPNAIKYFKDRLDDLYSDDITDILKEQPSLIGYFQNRLSELNSKNIEKILDNQPQLSKYFDKKSNIDELKKLGEYFLTKNGEDTYENFDKIRKEYFLEDSKIIELLKYLKSKTTISEALYQGHSVQLNKPMRGDVKKFKVYVKNKSGKVVKVNFGSKDYNIKKNNPKRKKSYCSRSKGIEGGGKDKTKANYWSRRMWKC